MDLRKPDFFMSAPKGHRICWNCTSIRVGKLPFRTCLEFPDKLIYNSPETEIEEEGHTTADKCREFVFDEEHRQELMKRNK